MEKVDKKEILEVQIRELLKARGEFFDFLDAKIPRKNGTDVFDFKQCEDDNLKAVYAKFYSYDYAIRRLLPYVYEAYGVKFNV